MRSFTNVSISAFVFTFAASVVRSVTTLPFTVERFMSLTTSPREILPSLSISITPPVTITGYVGAGVNVYSPAAVSFATCPLTSTTLAPRIGPRCTFIVLLVACPPAEEELPPQPVKSAVAATKLTKYDVLIINPLKF